MPTFVPNPKPASMAKNLVGISDTSYDGTDQGVYKFMGCSIVNASASCGFNSVATSLDVTLVEDIVNDDAFVDPVVPSIYAFSFPRGGVGAELFPSDELNLNPADSSASNVPFYFTGIVTGYRKDIKNVGGKFVNVSLADPREVLSGVICLTSGFALSNDVGVGTSDEEGLLGGLPEVTPGVTTRFGDVDNVIDCFGYFNYGMESERNVYGMPWNKVKLAIESARVTLFGMNFEFSFVGDAFNKTPDWYRIEEETIDLMSLVSKVAQDGGADFVVNAKKANTTTCLVVFGSIKRSDLDPLTQNEINDFINSRMDIVDTASIGREFRNEPTYNVVIGDRRNSNYVAWPTENVPKFHDHYLYFPPDCETRFFGSGDGATVDFDVPDSNLEALDATITEDMDIGSIFPFWGFMPDSQDPLIEPLLILDHVSFREDYDGFQRETIPLVKLERVFRTVRTVNHTAVFLEWDNDSDSRPFGVITDTKTNQAENQEGYLRALPLNTDILRAAMQNEYLFYYAYRMYYPDIADGLRFPAIDTQGIYDIYIANENTPLKDIDPSEFLLTEFKITNSNHLMLRRQIYQWVLEYANTHMGRQFIVCLPTSQIMRRIWNDDPVPTDVGLPTIEYVVSDLGYWENLPADFDGLSDSSSTDDNEVQIRERFMSEDGRFAAMAVVNRYPEGNGSYLSVGSDDEQKTEVMLQDIPVSEFRPNRIANVTPDRVFVSCGVAQLQKRPDLCSVTLPSTIHFDPRDTYYERLNHSLPSLSALTNEIDTSKHWLFSYGRIAEMLTKLFRKDEYLIDLLDVATVDEVGFDISEVINNWAQKMVGVYNYSLSYSGSAEVVLDLEAVIIPLISNWESYGPWYARSSYTDGMAGLDIDPSLVPWNFPRPDAEDIADSLPPDVVAGLLNSVGSDWDQNLNTAGEEKLLRSLSKTTYVDSATISVCGFPELGPSVAYGFNSNLTGISVSLDIGAIKTVYTFATYNKKPGTYRKLDHDNASRARRGFKTQSPETINFNPNVATRGGTNHFSPTWSGMQHLRQNR